MVPSVVVIILVLIPAIMATIGVVREKETGSISNFRSTPISKFEFLLGKLLPYVAVGDFSLCTHGADGACYLPRPGQGIFCSTGLRSLALRLFHLQLRAAYLHLRPDPSCGGVCHHGYRPHSSRQLWPVCLSDMISDRTKNLP